MSNFVVSGPKFTGLFAERERNHSQITCFLILDIYLFIYLFADNNNHAVAHNKS